MQYGLIGERLSHSFSKEIHESVADYNYELCEISRSDLPSFLEKRNFRAINVTIPYKKEVIPFLDEISGEAKKLDAVNVIVNKNGRLCGYNTDYLGLKDMIGRLKISFENKKVLVLGTGGAARTATLVAKDLLANEVIFVSRSEKDSCISYYDAQSKHNDAQIIINATPVGMYPDSYSSLLELNAFSKLEAVIDAIYNPLRTTLVLDAKDRGCIAEAGLYMLVSQAVYAIELFLDKGLPKEKAEEVYRRILKDKENIVLIGMPSCGKTTVGNILADKLGRRLVDLDDEIEKHIGCTIAEFFKTHTEKDFRDIESQITKEISKSNGIIIATGGGCVLRNDNIQALRSNGRLYFIDRSPENLVPTSSRPLASKKSDIEALYQKRYGLYCSACDFRINGDLAPEREAEQIREEFYNAI